MTSKVEARDQLTAGFGDRPVRIGPRFSFFCWSWSASVQGFLVLKFLPANFRDITQADFWKTHPGKIWMSFPEIGLVHRALHGWESGAEAFLPP